MLLGLFISTQIVRRLRPAVISSQIVWLFAGYNTSSLADLVATDCQLGSIDVCAREVIRDVLRTGDVDVRRGNVVTHARAGTYNISRNGLVFGRGSAGEVVEFDITDGEGTLMR